MFKQLFFVLGGYKMNTYKYQRIFLLLAYLIFSNDYSLTLSTMAVVIINELIMLEKPGNRLVISDTVNIKI